MTLCKISQGLNFTNFEHIDENLRNFLTDKIWPVQVTSIISRGNDPAKLTAELSSPIVGLERVGKHIVVGCMDQTINCFSMKVSGEYLRSN